MNKRLLVSLGAACMLLPALAQATPIEGAKVKWSQLPDMDRGNDTLSMHRSNGPVVADDFVSNGKPIYGFHWWGSYFQDTGQDAVAGFERQVQFEISFHLNCPAGSPDPQCADPAGNPYNYGTPYDRNGSSYFSRIVTAEEDFFGTTVNGVDIYEYWLAVDPTDGPSFLGGTWEEVAGETYWVDFAWNAGQFGTSVSDNVWGWAAAANGGTCILSCAVQTTPPSPGANPHLGAWAELSGRDMAFEVLSVPEPATVALLAAGLIGAGAASRRRAC